MRISTALRGEQAERENSKSRSREDTPSWPCLPGCPGSCRPRRSCRSGCRCRCQCLQAAQVLLQATEQGVVSNEAQNELQLTSGAGVAGARAVAGVACACKRLDQDSWAAANGAAGKAQAKTGEPRQQAAPRCAHRCCRCPTRSWSRCCRCPRQSPHRSRCCQSLHSACSVRHTRAGCTALHCTGSSMHQAQAA